MPTPPPSRMRPDELDIDTELVERLVAEQFPEWASLPVRPVRSAGTDNAMYRLGDALVVRLPRLADGAGQIQREHRWLPVLAPRLPLSVPVPVAVGAPGTGYGLSWGVYEWREGDNAVDAPLRYNTLAAEQLGRFVAALRRLDAQGAPPSYRGGPPGREDGSIRAAIRDLGSDGTIDPALATDVWERTLRLPDWGREPVWLHGDLLPGNLLTADGQLTAVIDFGCLGVGDPAADLMAAWTVFTADTREAFRAAAEVDDATWERGRGWALRFGLSAEHYYGEVFGNGMNPVLAGVGRRAVAEVLAECG
ncbi:aminoglycoside phosphotransferase family protein [Streptomyces sp. GXMU-J15]|uniref:Aminoglycoside phosphotransferase family protein n=1 Tax=Streptomyces fuscus TaxID=3048495 RepID=A0ABT7IZ91_9ACTN|nr:aminoglycoside phosphotransferase family protein [Streptomyces fuscus]MDL2077920.1 aminoglycoside phosphotransferase family protein [Streptomyces fuscus]